jgi:hypothetical protein
MPQIGVRKGKLAQASGHRDIDKAARGKGFQRARLFH